MSDVRRAIAAEVRAEMARKQKTQRDIAVAIGMHQQALQLRLVGTRAFRVEELVAVAAALGVPVEQFLPAGQGADPADTAAGAA